MATVRIFQAQLRVQTTRMASRRARQILNFIEREAQAITATGPYTTGKLSGSIRNTGPQTRGWAVTGSVYSRKPYAASVEGGAVVHDIFPKNAPHTYRFGKGARPMLKFYWRKAGRVVYAHQVPMSPGTIGVSHPGQKGKGFLRRPLVDAALRYRMRVIIYDI